MKPEIIIRLLEKSDDCLESAEFNFREGFYDATVNRTYYAVFDVVTALLFAKQVTVKSHSGVIQQFALHFIKDGLLPVEMQENLLFCFQKRQKGDYDFYSNLTEEEALTALDRARNFINKSKSWIEENYT